MKSRIARFLEDHFIKVMAASLILIVIGSYKFYIKFSTFSVAESLTATSIVASSVLTFALIAVYWRMSGIQKRQKNVMENQENLMETQSDILAAEFEPEVIHGEVGFDGQLMGIRLRNVGDNVAKYFRLGLDFPNSQAGRTTNAQEISNISLVLKREGPEVGGYYAWILEVGEEDWFPGEVAREILEYDSPGHMHLVGLDWQAERVVFYHCDREEVIFVTLHSNGLANGGAVMGSFEWGFETWVKKMGAYWGWLQPRYR